MTRPRGNIEDLVKFDDSAGHVDVNTAKQIAGAGPMFDTPDGAVPPIITHLRSDAVRDQFTAALPDGISTHRYVRVCETMLLETPRFLLVPPDVLMSTLLRAAGLGLEPNSPLGHLFLEPKMLEGGRYGIRWILGYKGIVQLIYRSPYIDSIKVTAVREGDEYAFEQGTDAYLMHKQALTDRGDLRFFYVLIHYAGAARPDFEIITLDQINERRDLSDAVKNNDQDSAWFTNEYTMQRKTCLRIIHSELPLAADAADAISLDGAAITDTTPDPTTEPDPKSESKVEG